MQINLASTSKRGKDTPYPMSASGAPRGRRETQGLLKKPAREKGRFIESVTMVTDPKVEFPP